ncbi:polysaccharide biosynthesis/export family protein [Microvirga pakistanensis]|uniref:polysaccharide biosynthesis/export family protein n=1 Tax=Microvirga pakistanensis TaxID=1682650 RepID=UPI00141AFD26|nr:polysaccharide biosynthesis/export family protein [Microvirga pakistanensis]
MRSLPLLALLACLSGPAFAQSAPGPDPAPEQRGSDLANAEKLTLRFPGSQEMTGDYRIGEDGTISVPILGRMSVGGFSTAQLEEALSRRLEQMTGRSNSVTVEVAAYRPVFVTGLVTRSGAVPWHPGMTVLQAVALSGGLFRPTGPNIGGPAAGEAEMARYRRATEDRKRALAALARLQAERQDSTEIQIPPALVAIAGQQEAEGLIAAQKTLLLSRQKSLTNQLASLKRGMELAAQELDGLREQSQRVSEQLKMRRDSRARLGELQQKGIVIAQRAFEEDLKVSELEEKTANVAVSTARVQATVAALQRDTVALTEERRASVEAEIDRLQKEVAQLADEAASARQSYNAIAGASLDAQRGDRTEIVYAVVRREGTGETTERAAQSTLLKPGDVLVVSQDLRSGG